MSHCDPEMLGAYFDRELSEDLASGVELHLQHCPECRAELARLGEVSRRLGDHPFDELSKHELDRLHRVIDEAASRPIWRLGGMLLAAAASVLIVSGAWLMELPAGRSASQQMAQNRPAAWEQVATSLRPDPFPDVNDHSAQFADAGLTEWMLQGLTGKIQP